MDFALDEQQSMIADSAEAFFAANASSERVRMAGLRGGFDAALWADFNTVMGFGAILLPESQGGAGFGVAELAMVGLASGRRLAALPYVGQAALIGALLQEDAPDADLIATIASGEKTVAVADGPLAPFGDHCDILLDLSGGTAKLCFGEADDFTAETVASLDPAMPLARVSVRGGRTLGAKAAGAAREVVAVCLAAEAVGGAQEAIDRTVEFSLGRRQFGRPIGSFQAYKHRLADRAVDLEQARSALWWAAAAVDEQAADLALALHAAKSFCADTFVTCAGDMIQLHGGIAFTWEHDAHLYLKRARTIAALFGSSPQHREAVAAIILDDAA